MSVSSWLLCATPRTGSTLLCSLIRSTGVAGNPESYFRTQDEDTFARSWEVPRAPDGCMDDRRFFDAVRKAGSTNNGVFAARIMWGTMDELLQRLRPPHPHLAECPRRLLDAAFDTPAFVYLRRKDMLAQAVSWARAEQTDFWHDCGDGSTPLRAPEYSFEQIDRYLCLIQDHNTAWQMWFRSLDIRPYEVTYEELSGDPTGTTRALLEFFGLKLPRGVSIRACNRRLADDVSAEWIERYRAAVAEHGDLLK